MEIGFYQNDIFEFKNPENTFYEINKSTIFVSIWFEFIIIFNHNLKCYVPT